MPTATQPARRLNKADWRKTPYALSEVSDPDKSVRDLLKRYGVKDVQFTETDGPNGRPSFSVRFRLGDHTYRVGVETLNAEAKPDDLVRQVKRAVYYQLKTLLEFATVFGPVEKVLFSYLEADSGHTMYDLAAPNLPSLKATGSFARLALPAASGVTS